MAVTTTDAPKFTETDLDFVVDAAAPEAQNKESLKQLILEDADFRKALLENDRVFNRLMVDEEAFLKISTPLYFEVLLRKSRNELGAATHTIERTGRESIPVFDTREVMELLGEPGVLSTAAPEARTLQLSEVFELLGEHFTWARKPLGFIATNYLHARRSQLFSLRTQ